MSNSESTASGASTDDKTATIKYKPVTSLAGNNNALAHYKQSCGYNQISHALSNIHGLYECSCNLFDVISVYSKLPGHFSYEWPGYEARNPEIEQTIWRLCNTCEQSMNFACTLIYCVAHRMEDILPPKEAYCNLEE